MDLFPEAFDEKDLSIRRVFKFLILFGTPVLIYGVLATGAYGLYGVFLDRSIDIINHVLAFVLLGYLGIFVPALKLTRIIKGKYQDTKMFWICFTGVFLVWVIIIGTFFTWYNFRTGFHG